MGETMASNPTAKSNGSKAPHARLGADDDFEIPVRRQRAPIVATRKSPPPLAVRTKLQSRRPKPPAALNENVPFLLAKGRGLTGKTTFIRAVANEMIEHGARRVLIGALDPGQRLLAEFLARVRQPATTDTEDIARFFLEDLIGVAKSRRVPAVVDSGGGSTALEVALARQPNLVLDLDTAGVSLIPCYFFSPAQDDVWVLEDHARIGFTPPHALLVLNAHHAARVEAYDGVRAHPAYQAAIARGAIEFVLPDLDQSVAQPIEDARYHFSQALDPTPPEGKPALELTEFETIMVREFLEDFRAESRDLVSAGWMPWEEN